MAKKRFTRDEIISEYVYFIMNTMPDDCVNCDEEIIYKSLNKLSVEELNFELVRLLKNFRMVS